jgi:mono/diheme cytochrome c family protein
LTEIPEHLLKRSAERKAAMAGEPAPADAPTAGTAVEPAAAAPAVAAASAPDVAPEPEPVRTAPYVKAYEARKKMPYWIIPVLLTLPVWAAMYVGTLERVPQGLTGLLGEGEELYVEAGCSGCHGAEGGGGIGPELADGEVHITFTSIEDQIAWIATGSAQVGTGNAYSSSDSTRPRAVSGQMPGFGAGASDELDVEQLLAVTLFERTQFEPDEAAALRDLLLAEQMNLLIETGELEPLLEEQGLSLHDVLDAENLTADMVGDYLAPARTALAETEG